MVSTVLTKETEIALPKKENVHLFWQNEFLYIEVGHKPAWIVQHASADVAQHIHKPVYHVTDKMIVNYIRHRLTSYDTTISKLRHYHQRYKINSIIIQTYRAIAHFYPRYRVECQIQLQQHLGSKEAIKCNR